MNHIELFAGCGGLSLGLELAGFELSLANELSPMAGETFAYNLLGENLEELAASQSQPLQTIWLSSKYSELSKRLRENPFEYPPVGEGYCDLPQNPNELKSKLVVGNIIHFNQLLESNSKLKKALQTGFNSGGVDVLSGGPPCQSFSLAGLRRKDCDKNTLPWEFAKFAEHIRPKIVVLENVTGILRAFKEGGISYHAWFEIAKVFCEKGFIPVCIHVNARQSGVPQNRPRFIMIGLRADLYPELRIQLNSSELKILAASELLYKALQQGKNYKFEDFHYYDTARPNDRALIEDSFFKELVGNKEVSVRSAIDDLKLSNPTKKSAFVNKLNKSFSGLLTNKKELQNHEPRSNNKLVQRRFRIYQILQKCTKETNKQTLGVLKGQLQELSESAWNELKTYAFLSNNHEYVKFGKRADLENYLKLHPTKKQTQKALDPESPAPAALSIPDDACHYDEEELRTLTVREMARIQSFPDQFVFRSKVTTGGQMRRFEVPQYTQVGNAVPPLLGYRLGLTLKSLLDKL